MAVEHLPSLTEAIGLFPSVHEYSRKTKLGRLAKNLLLLKPDALRSLCSLLYFYKSLKFPFFKVLDNTEACPRVFRD